MNCVSDLSMRQPATFLVMLTCAILMTSSQSKAKTGLAKSEQEAVGAMCKRLIDAGRLRYLEERGFSARLHRYVDKSLSLENVALVVTRSATVCE